MNTTSSRGRGAVRPLPSVRSMLAPLLLCAFLGTLWADGQEGAATRPADAAKPPTSQPASAPSGGGAKQLLKSEFDIACLGTSLKKFLEENEEYRPYFVKHMDRPGSGKPLSGIDVPVPWRDAREAPRTSGRDGLIVGAYDDVIFAVRFGPSFTGRIEGLAVRLGDTMKKLEEAYGDRVTQLSNRIAVRLEKVSLVVETESIPAKEDLEQLKKLEREPTLRRGGAEQVKKRLQRAIELAEHPELAKITYIAVNSNEFAPPPGVLDEPKSKPAP